MSSISNDFSLSTKHFSNFAKTGMKFGTKKTCRDYGCRNPVTNEFVKSGQKVYLSTLSKECTCVRGTDPNLADDYTLFHLRCRLKSNIKSCILNETEHNFGTVVQASPFDRSH